MTFWVQTESIQHDYVRIALSSEIFRHHLGKPLVPILLISSSSRKTRTQEIPVSCRVTFQDRDLCLKNGTFSFSGLLYYQLKPTNPFSRIVLSLPQVYCAFSFSGLLYYQHVRVISELYTDFLRV